MKYKYKDKQNIIFIFMIVTINKKNYAVNDNEFKKIDHPIYTNLRILKNLDVFEKLTSFFHELKSCLNTDKNEEKNILFLNSTHGGFLPIEVSKFFDNVILLDTEEEHYSNITTNIKNHDNKNNKSNIIISNDNEYNSIKKGNSILFVENTDVNVNVNVNDRFIEALNDNKNNILVSPINTKLINKQIYKYIIPLKNTNYYVYLNDIFYNSFISVFKYYLEEENSLLNYDNLINLCIMVKNAGPQFEDMLKQNLNIIDRWTILDTGSDDMTIDIINNVLVGKKQGNLYQEPFINFRDSRNRLLDLAGEQCKFNVMLDDTYILKGDLRSFLNEVRGDQYSNSFTLFIQSDDTEYGSNRITKSNSGLRYVHKIHEVISDKNNINVIVPIHKAFLLDQRFDYMEKRTYERKQLDLKLLYEELEDDPMNPRTYYYLAQTYNLLRNYEKAYEFFLKRAEFSNAGFLQERLDAIFEAARIANFQLGKPWNECLYLYEKCYKVDESRPESLYFIGIHYHLEGNNREAYKYFKKGFEIGYPQHCQYSLKPTLSFHFLPKFLTRICYELEDYKLGESAAELFLLNNKPNADDYPEILSWYNIYKKINMYNGPKVPTTHEKPIFCFVADGGFNQWSGSNILTTGVGGSETYIIEMARWIQKSGLFQTYVFCNTPNEGTEVFDGTIYKPLTSYYEFVNTNYIHHCMISRFSEYLPVTFKGWTENVYFVIHDLTPSGIVIPMDKKLKQIFCLTEWHVEYFTSIFPQLRPITTHFYYGCAFNKKSSIESSLEISRENNLEKNKVPYSFIYSSFPNRGLLQLLQMWPKIYEFQPKATLHIFADVNNKWSNDVEPEKMQAIRTLLEDYSKRENGLGVHYHGWVSKNVLNAAWETADIWFYPCTFMETFCLTALEAASTKTLVITNDLAALQNTVGDRGYIIKGDPTTNEWQEEALQKTFFCLDPNNKDFKNSLIERNYEWATSLTWEKQAKKLLDNHVLPNKIEYKGMYNWTHDLPFGSREVFLENLKYFNDNYPKIKEGKPIHMLEIGTYTGTSLIDIVKNIPNSFGCGLDKWCSYNENELLKNMDSLGIEGSFYKNIQAHGLTERIKGIKNNSFDCLLEFIKKDQLFDLIYVDGSHLLLDCYADLILSWQVLEKDGLMIIDDYLYNSNSLLDSPFEAVNHFLKSLEGKYKLLHKSYRVFLQKI